MLKTDKKASIIVGVLILGLFCGCACRSIVNKQEFSKVEILLNDKDLRIRELEVLLAEKQVQTQEKDKQIEAFKEKLRGLGIF